MKKLLIGALTAIMLFGLGAMTSEACCGGNYYCNQDCDDQSGEYCGRYGCGQGQGNGYRGGR